MLILLLQLTMVLLTIQFRKYSRNENVIVLNEAENRGKGFALRKGFTKAVELGCDAVITLDADMQHNPKSIPALLFRT